MKEQKTEIDINAQEKDQESNDQHDIVFSEENINDLIKQAVSDLGPYEIYNEALSYIDLDLLKTETADGTITAENLSINFSVAGFAAGIKFALSNVKIERAE